MKNSKGVNDNNNNNNDNNYLYFSYIHERITTWAEGLGNNGINRDPPNYYIIEIGQNTGDLRRLDVTQRCCEKNYQKRTNNNLISGIMDLIDGPYGDYDRKNNTNLHKKARLFHPRWQSKMALLYPPV